MKSSIRGHVEGHPKEISMMQTVKVEVCDQEGQFTALG
jgi:hypothetical protein